MRLMARCSGMKTAGGFGSGKRFNWYLIAISQTETLLRKISFDSVSMLTRADSVRR